MIKVFISGTYLDLIDYRKSVIEQIHRMKETHSVNMEVLGASDKDPTTLSLEELEQCQIYLAIIGHRYGTVHENYSITEWEYKRALELYKVGKMKILPYLADRTVALLPDLFNDEAGNEKQIKFRKKLLENHKPGLFSTPQDLALQVSVDLPGLINQGDYRDSFKVKVFDADAEKIEQIGAEIDSATQERLHAIESFLEYTADFFKALFKLSPTQLDIHPFFEKVRGRLRNLFPGIALNPKDGVLMRAKVRHVILRTRTLLALIEKINPKELRGIGKEAGESAAEDLIDKNLRPKQLVPASPEAFVALWDFWDRTGGWGHLELIEPEVSKNKWRIQIRNNFLRVSSAKKTHRLCEFWCGYIHGFLDKALPQITEIMVELGEDERVTLPSFLRVERVEHQHNSDATKDIFCISFKPEPFSEPIQLLKTSKEHLDNKRYKTGTTFSRRALLTAREVKPHCFNQRLNEAVAHGPKFETIAKVLAHQPSDVTKEFAEKLFREANSFVKRLASVGDEGK